MENLNRIFDTGASFKLRITSGVFFDQRSGITISSIFHVSSRKFQIHKLKLATKIFPGLSFLFCIGAHNGKSSGVGVVTFPLYDTRCIGCGFLQALRIHITFLFHVSFDPRDGFWTITVIDAPIVDLLRNTGTRQWTFVRIFPFGSTITSNPTITPIVGFLSYTSTVIYHACRRRSVSFNGVDRR